MKKRILIHNKNHNMKPNNCTLLIDGNWLLMSRIFSGKDISMRFAKGSSQARLNAAKETLKDMMATSINKIINKMPFIDNIVLVTDGGSWRKQLAIPKQLGDITYKGNRNNDALDVDWDYAFGALKELAKSCNEAGVTTCTQYNIEGDDWIWYWSRVLNAQGVNCVVWSIDNDLRQLVQCVDGAFTAWLSERNNIYTLALPKSLEEIVPDPEDLDFLMTPPTYKPATQVQLEEIAGSVMYTDPNEVINDKVICGDKGDNIQSIARKFKNGRKFGIGPKDFEKLTTNLNIKTINDIINHQDEIANYIINMKKFADADLTITKIKEMIEYNVKLVWLNEAVIPETITTIMNTQEYRVVNMDYIRGSYKTLLEQDNDIEEIFEGAI